MLCYVMLILHTSLIMVEAEELQKLTQGEPIQECLKYAMKTICMDSKI